MAAAVWPLVTAEASASAVMLLAVVAVVPVKVPNAALTARQFSSAGRLVLIDGPDRQRRVMPGMRQFWVKTAMALSVLATA